MKISFLDFKNLVIKQNVFKKIPWFFAKHAFWIILVFISIVIMFGGFLFQNCVVSIKEKNLEITDNSLKFREDLYQKLLGQWQVDEKSLENDENKKYPNPFVQSE